MMTPMLRYDLADDSGAFLPVATTRPETILGDAAVCVHPDDERFRRFVGKTVLLPVEDADCAASGRRRAIPVIADTYVDMAFGTGALKITPAHDANDYEIGKRHGLPILTMLGKDGAVNRRGGPKYAGLDR